MLGGAATDLLTIRNAIGPTAVSGTFDLRVNYTGLWLPIRGAWNVLKGTSTGEALITYLFYATT